MKDLYYEAIAKATAEIVTEQQMLLILELAKNKVSPDSVGHDWANTAQSLLLISALKL